MNRRNLLSLLGMSPVLLTGDPARAGQAKRADSGADSGQAKITAVNPKGMPPAIQLIPMAPRLASLDGKTVYLVDTGFHGSDMLLQQIEAWFKRNMPQRHDGFPAKGRAIRARRSPQLWEEIKAQGNAVIMAVGH